MEGLTEGVSVLVVEVSGEKGSVELLEELLEVSAGAGPSAVAVPFPLLLLLSLPLVCWGAVRVMRSGSCSRKEEVGGWVGKGGSEVRGVG